jgi:predicted MFS family arabinose efflux permease
VVEIAGKQDLMNAIALNSSMFNLARVIGPAIAGVIMMRLGVSWCFIINVFSFLAVLIALFYVQAAEVPIIKRTESIAQYTLSGFRYVKQNKTILNVMVLMVMMGIFGWSYSVLIPALAKDVFSQGEQGYAMLVSSIGLGALFGALFVAYMGNTEHRKRLIDCGVYFFSIMLFLLALSKSYWLSLILLMGTGIGLLVYFSSSTTLIQSCVDDSFRGRIMGIWALIFGGTMPIGSFLVGIVSERFGIALTLLACSIICPLFTFILSLYSKEEEQAKPKELVEAAGT